MMSPALFALIALLPSAGPEKDLQIELKLHSPALIQPGTYLDVKARLVNRSTTTSHRIVKSNDGSEMAWREPYVFYTAEVQRADGSWEAVPKRHIGRCGLYAHDWTQDVMDLGPGKSVEIGWMAQPQYALDLPMEGRVLLRVHYAYRHAKRATRSGIDPLTSPMGSIAPFEVVSNAVEFQIHAPLAVDIAATGTRLKSGRPTTLSDILTVAVRGLDPSTAVGTMSLEFEIRGSSPGWRPRTTAREGKAGAFVLKRGARRALVGSRAAAFQGMWDYPKAETVTIRAILRRTVKGKRTTFRSPFVEVVVR